MEAEEMLTRLKQLLGKASFSSSADSYQCHVLIDGVRGHIDMFRQDRDELFRKWSKCNGVTEYDTAEKCMLIAKQKRPKLDGQPVSSYHIGYAAACSEIAGEIKLKFIDGAESWIKKPLG